jgi:signal transduction histidine kinase
MRFRTYLFWLFGIAVFIPCATFSVLLFDSAVQQVTADNDRQRTVAVAAAYRLNKRLGELEAMMATISKTYLQMPDRTPELLSGYLSAVRQNEPVLINLHFDGADGTSIAFSPRKNAEGESNIGIDHTDRYHWMHRPAEERVHIGNLVQAQGGSDKLIINLTHPIYKNGEFLGLAVAAVDVKALTRGIFSPQILAKYFVVVADRKGAVIFDTSRRTSLEPIIPKELFTETGNSWASFTAPDGVEYEGDVESVGGNAWVLGVFRPKSEIRAVMTESLAASGLVFLGLMLLTLALAHVAARPLVRAVKLLDAQAKEGVTEADELHTVRFPTELANLQKQLFSARRGLQTAGAKLEVLNRTLETKVASQVKEIHGQVELLTRVFGRMTEGLVLLDANHRITYMNKKAEELIPGESLIGKDLMEVLLKHYRSEQSTRIWFSGDPVRLIRLEGEQAVDATLFTLGRDVGSCFGFMMHDTTAEIEMMRLKNDIIGMVAHELKSPLATIRMQAEMLTSGAVTEKDDEFKEITGDMQTEVDRLRALIENWLNVARLDAGSYVVERRPIVLKDMVAEATNIVRRTGDLQVSLEDETGMATLPMDREGAQLITVNLLSNSVRYADPSRPAKVRIRVEIIDGEIVYHVSDNGIGIPKEYLGRIFDRFFQVNMGSKRSAGGTGLGLVIVEGIVRLHGGTISVTSEVGRGTTFVIRVPL